MSCYTATPVIDTPSLSVIIATIGSSLTLSCISRGSPPDTFTWMKENNQTVLQSTNITAVDYTSTSAVFCANYVIDNVTTSDSGTYKCTVTNPIGSDNATITVVTSKLIMQCMTTITIIYIIWLKDMYGCNYMQLQWIMIILTNSNKL